MKRLLDDLGRQDTKDLFSYSIVVADNDAAKSAEAVVADFTAGSLLKVTYCVQPEQNIALTRNEALSHATGDFIAFIDDDEFPISNWLLILFTTCRDYRADGVVGSVKPHFEVQPPNWVIRGRFCERETYATGSIINWPQGRTGNLLFKRELLEGVEQAFRPEFLTAEDQDFFRRMIEKGRVFVWCNEAIAYEEVPPVRWERGFMLKRALLRGRISLHHPTSKHLSLVKSMVALPLYLLALPFLLLFGQHVFTSYLVKSFDHIGKILGFLKMSPIRPKYVTQ